MGEYFFEGVNIINSESKYLVIIDPEKVNLLFQNISPFNLKKDFKKINDIPDYKIAGEIRAILQGKVRGKAYTEISYQIYKGKKISISKVRLTDLKQQKGKRGGLRCIALVDDYTLRCIILHIYSKNIKEDITKKEENQLKKLLNKYISSYE